MTDDVSRALAWVAIAGVVVALFVGLLSYIPSSTHGQKIQHLDNKIKCYEEGGEVTSKIFNHNIVIYDCLNTLEDNDFGWVVEY